jgi:hypothetical protein
MKDLHYKELAEILLNWFGDDEPREISEYLAVNLLQVSRGNLTIDEFLESINEK